MRSNTFILIVDQILRSRLNGCVGPSRKVYVVARMVVTSKLNMVRRSTDERREEMRSSIVPMGSIFFATTKEAKSFRMRLSLIIDVGQYRSCLTDGLYHCGVTASTDANDRSSSEEELAKVCEEQVRVGISKKINI